MAFDFEPEMLEGQNGVTLAIRTLQAKGTPKGILHINHGMAEHSARYERFAKELSSAGYHVIAHDHRGHGQTTAKDAPLGVFAGSGGKNKVLADCLTVNKHARSIWPNLPLIYFGHSMGGIIGTTYTINHANTLDGAVLWNFNVDGGALVSLLRGLLKAERMFKGSDVPSLLANKLTFEDWNKKFAPNRTDFDWLSRDEAEVDKYVADPLCGFACSVGLWLDVTQFVQYGASNRELGKLKNKSLPVNLLGGEADPSSMNGKSMTRLAQRLRRHGMEDVIVSILPNTRHETLNEINRDEATGELIAWLDGRWG